MEKENRRLKILLGILSVFAIVLCGYFVYTVYKLNNGTTGHYVSSTKYSYSDMEGVYKLKTNVIVNGKKRTRYSNFIFV